MQTPINYDEKFVIKPNSEGSSIGVKIIPKNNKENILLSNWDNSDDLIAEEYIHGKELTVGVLNGKPLCVTEIISEFNTFYDYNSKYVKDGSKHIIPANIPDKIRKQALKWAEKSYKFSVTWGAQTSTDDIEGEIIKSTIKRPSIFPLS